MNFRFVTVLGCKEFGKRRLVVYRMGMCLPESPGALKEVGLNVIQQSADF